MNDRQTSQSFSSLPRSQKTAVVALSILAVGILFVWFWQFNNRLNNPFEPSKAEIAQAEKAAAAQAAAEKTANTKDTDSDGLTDSDETNVYATSPYLEDTDGDNISDFEEVRLGKDPLCAEGSNCSLVASENTSTGSSTLAIDDSLDTPASNVDQALLIKALSGEGDADTMRQILLQGGADADQVKLLTDADLMEMYSDVLGAQNPTLISASTTASTTNQ